MFCDYARSTLQPPCRTTASPKTNASLAIFWMQLVLLLYRSPSSIFWTLMPKFAHVEPWVPPRVTSVHVDPWTMPPRGKSVHVEHTSTWQIGTRGSKFQIRLRPLPANTQLFIASAGDFILQPISPLRTSDCWTDEDVTCLYVRSAPH